MMQAVTLIKIMIMGAINRLRFDFARELVVLISGGVVVATFAYIINDFLNVQISGLSQVMRDRFAEPLAIAFLLIAAFRAGGAIRSEWSGLQTPSRMATFLGESPTVINIYMTVHSIAVLTILHGVSWWIVRRYLVQPDPTRSLAMELIMLLTSAASAYLYRESKKGVEHETSTWLARDPASTKKLFSFVRWRIAQIGLRNRTTKICFFVALSMYLLLIPLQLAGIPFFASVACSIMASIVASSVIFFQLAEDLNYAWAERTMGISHADFCKGYQHISIVIAVPLIATALGCYVIGSMLAGSDSFSASNAVKLILINLSTPLIAPMMMFQIDARRPIINFILLTIGAMFIDTAIFANSLCFLLLPVFHYYANGSQNGRFYRA